MNLSQAQINRFNRLGALIVVASFPQKGSIHDKNKDALASFTKNRILGLQKHTKNKIIVLTHQDDSPTIEEDDNLLVVRCFEKNKPQSFLAIFQIIKKFNLVRDILIEFEFSTFGDNLMTLCFLPFLASLKGAGKHLTIELHQVLTRIEDLRGHLGYAKHSFKARLFNPALISFYSLIGKLADKIIVLESHLKDRLSTIVSADKIEVLPHGVQKIKTKITQAEAKKQLGFSKDDFVVMSFGYLTWYKGSDLFVKAAEELSPHKHIKFVLAGGISHNQKHKTHYQKWYNKILTSIKNTFNLTHTDFVDEKSISLYYQAADLVVFPYRTFMSSSGPLSLTLSHNKPFILSRKLKPYLYSEDIGNLLNNVELIKEDLLFSTYSASLAKKILYLSKHAQKLHKIKLLSQKVASQRFYENLGIKQNHIIHENKNSLQMSFAPAKMLN